MISFKKIQTLKEVSAKQTNTVSAWRVRWTVPETFGNSLYTFTEYREAIFLDISEAEEFRNAIKLCYEILQMKEYNQVVLEESK